jgi:hypothetical protein
MRFISTRTHGMLDYPLGVLLVLAPWLLGLDPGAQSRVPIAIGVIVLLTSLMTDYELGLFRLLPMSAHLGLDALAGAVLAVSPWLFGFAGQVWVPHVVLGLLQLGAGLMTSTQPGDRVEERGVGEEPRRRAMG